MKHSRFVCFKASTVAAVLLALPAGTLFAAEDTIAANAGTDWKAFLAPFHSVFLHLPIGFVTIALVLEVYAWFHKGDSLRRAIGLVLWISAASAIFVTLLGIFRAGNGGYDVNALEFHRYTGIAVASLTSLLALIHCFAFPKVSVMRKGLAITFRIMLIANVGLISVAGHYGGNLTHGSRYLFEDAPGWVREWAEKAEATIARSFINSPATGGDVVSADVSDSNPGFFAEVIRPIFEEKCFQCHGLEKQKSDYRMDTPEGLFAAGESELEPIVANRPLKSYLVEVITLPSDDDYVMPPEGKEQLTAEEILAVIHWIGNGAEIGPEIDAKPTPTALDGAPVVGIATSSEATEASVSAPN